MSAPVRVVAHVAALLAGAAAGVLGSFVHPLRWHGLPYGLVLGLALTFSVVVTAGLLTRSRSAAAAAGLGWLVATVTLSVQRREGDLVVPATSLGYAWLLGGLVVVMVAMAWPYSLLPVRRSTGEAAEDRSTPSGSAPIGR